MSFSVLAWLNACRKVNILFGFYQAHFTAFHPIHLDAVDEKYLGRQASCNLVMNKPCLGTSCKLLSNATLRYAVTKEKEVQSGDKAVVDVQVCVSTGAEGINKRHPLSCLDMMSSYRSAPDLVAWTIYRNQHGNNFVEKTSDLHPDLFIVASRGECVRA